MSVAVGSLLARLLLLSLLFLGMAGCESLPKPTPRAQLLEMPALKETLQGSHPIKWGDWPRSEWWRDFHSPALNDLIARALEHNPSLQAAAHRVREAQALAEIRAAELFPSIEASLSLTGQRFSANSVQSKFAGESFVLALFNPLNVRYYLDFWGRNRAALEAALGIAQAKEAELAQARLLLATALARTYFRMVAAAEGQRLSQAMLDLQRQHLDIDQFRVARGLDPKAPLYGAEQKLEQAKQQQAIRRAETEILRAELAALTSHGPDWGRQIPVKATQFPREFPLPKDLPLKLLAHRPDVAAARYLAEAAAQEIKVAKTAFYPNVNLMGFAGLHSANLPDLLFSGQSLAFLAGPVLDLPIFEGGRLRANLKAKQAAYDAAVEAYNNTLLRAVQGVAEALAHWKAVHDLLIAQRDSLEAMRKNERLAEVGYKTGLNDQRAVLGARYALYQERFQLITLEAEYLQAAVGLIEALGGGYHNSAVPAPR
jgi:NodT family efflux transporter outer membrane factor (OMF) lipoprotein